MRLLLASILACASVLSGPSALADVGGDVQSELTYVQSSEYFKNVAVVNGPIEAGLQRWKRQSRSFRMVQLRTRRTAARNRARPQLYGRGVMTPWSVA